MGTMARKAWRRWFLLLRSQQGTLLDGGLDEKGQLNMSETECHSHIQNGPPSNTDGTQSEPTEQMEEDADEDDVDLFLEMFRPNWPRQERRKRSRSNEIGRAHV